MSASRRNAGFTLLETIIALGVLAVGATTALALLVAAASSGRRAEHHVSAAIVADSVFAEVEALLDGSFDPASLAAAPAPPPRPSDPGDGPLRAVPLVDPRASARSGPGGAPGAAPKTPTPSGAGPNGATGTRAFDEDPFARSSSLVLRSNQVFQNQTDYKYDVYLTPVGGPPDDPWEFLVEVVVRWTEKGAKRDAVYQTILLRHLSHLDNLDAKR